MQTTTLRQPWHIGFWKPREMAQLFEAGALSQKQILVYFFVFLLLGVLIIEGLNYVYLATTDLVSISHLDYILSLMNIGGFIVGFFYLKKLHTSDRSFLEKYVVVTTAALFDIFFVVLLPVFVLSVIAYGVVYGVETVPLTLTWIDVLSMFAFIVGMYWRLGVFFKQSQKSTN